MAGETAVLVPKWPTLTSRTDPVNGATELRYHFGDAWRIGGPEENADGLEAVRANSEAGYLAATVDPVFVINLKGRPFFADTRPYTWDMIPPVPGLRSWPVIRLFLERSVVLNVDPRPAPDADPSLLSGERYNVYRPEVQVFRLQRDELIDDRYSLYQGALGRVAAERKEEDETLDAIEGATPGPPDPIELMGRPHYWYHTLATVEDSYGGVATDNPIADPDKANPLIPVLWIVPRPAGVTITHRRGSGSNDYWWQLSIEIRDPTKLAAFAYCFGNNSDLAFEVRVVITQGVEISLTEGGFPGNTIGIARVFYDFASFGTVPEQGEYLYFRSTGNESWSVPSTDERLPARARTWSFRPVEAKSGTPPSRDELLAIVAFELALGLFPPAADVYDIAQFGKAMLTGKDFYGQSVSDAELLALGLAALLPVLDSGKLRAADAAADVLRGD